MALYPPAIQKPITPGSNDLGIVPVLLIFHVRAGTGPSLFDYFNGPSGGVESHFYIRFDGTTEQYRDTAIDADANMDANAWVGPDGKRYGAISVETEGLADGTWTPQQLATLKDLTLWCNATHGIPLKIADNPRGPGVGYHILFMREWAGGPRACPGPARIRQFYDVLAPWMASNPTAKPKDEDMALSAAVQAQLDQLQTALKAVSAPPPVPPALARVIVGYGPDPKSGKDDGQYLATPAGVYHLATDHEIYCAHRLASVLTNPADGALTIDEIDVINTILSRPLK